MHDLLSYKSGVRVCGNKQFEYTVVHCGKAGTLEKYFGTTTRCIASSLPPSFLAAQALLLSYSRITNLSTISFLSLAQ